MIWFGRQRYRLAFPFACVGLLFFTGLSAYISFYESKGPLSLPLATRLAVPLCLIIGCLALFWLAVEVGRVKNSKLLELMDMAPWPDPLEASRTVYAIDGISIASGIPRPKVSIVNDNCLNAFTVPETDGTAHLCLTSGLIRSLSLEELTGVVAHEFAHIKNGDLSRFRAGPALLWRLQKKRFHQKRWLAYLYGALPMLIWFIATAAAFFISFAGNTDSNPTSGVTVICYFLTSFLFFTVLLSPEVTSGESLEERFSVDFVADRDALGWTFNPLAFQSALRKCRSGGNSDALEVFSWISFVCTRPETPYFWRNEPGTPGGYAYYSPDGILLDDQQVVRGGTALFKSESLCPAPQQASVEHRLFTLGHYQQRKVTASRPPFPDLCGEIPRHGS